MTIVILGAGAAGTATAWYPKKAGYDAEVIERQPEAGMETSWGNGGVIHASEVEPWSQPGMPRKVIGWLGKEMRHCSSATALFPICGDGVWSSRATARRRNSAPTPGPISIWRYIR